VPGNAWGSVVGNALERGFGSSPYGDHASRICGLEVVLPTGELIRTGMGAMRNNPTWPLFRYGYGPSWDGLFQQSNLGVVTKMGLWLMPEPEATLGLSIELPKADDIGWALDELCPLRMQGVLQQSPNIGNYLRSAASRSQRSDWWTGPGAMPDEVIGKIQQTYGVGWWSIGLRLYGHPEVNEINARTIQAAFAKHTDQPFKITRWKKGEPFAASGAGIPAVQALQIVNWRGGRGGHIGFSPVLPPSGEHALGQLHRAQKLVREHGFDFYGSFTVNDRYINHVNMLFYDRDDAAMVGQVRELMKVLIRETAAAGYGEYRAHLDFMDEVALSFDFNDHALLKLNERLKDALDPNGVIAPGKQGVWPATHRGTTA
jgi:4-cresol dehydrogenase (hydroxylating)